MNQSFIELYEQNIEDSPRCHWCGRLIFKPNSELVHNRVHVGGVGEVWACDDCKNEKT